MAMEGRASRPHPRGSDGRYKVLRCSGAVYDTEDSHKEARKELGTPARCPDRNGCPVGAVYAGVVYGR